MEHSEFYTFATHFWWLIFPLAWMAAAFARIFTRHRESQQILDMVKSYADQGKEPPAALAEMFGAPRRRGDCYREPYYTHRLWRRAFLFGFLCLAFTAMTVWPNIWPGDTHRYGPGFFIPALVMGALFASCLGALMMRPRLPPDQK